MGIFTEKDNEPINEMAKSFKRPTLYDFAKRRQTHEMRNLLERGRRILDYTQSEINRDLREAFDGRNGFLVLDRKSRPSYALIEYLTYEWTIFYGPDKLRILSVEVYVRYNEENREEIVIKLDGQRTKKQWKISLVTPSVDGILSQLRYAIIDEMKYYV